MTINDPACIGPYEIVREIGRGGMGVVYLARDSRLDREVALKELPPDLAADPARLVRFEREAKALAQLNHPNVASIFGIEESGGRKLLVLEFVDGGTLADRLDRGPIAIDQAIEIAEQIAAGVEAAHEAGVIHRDLKPGNIGMTATGVVKVLDFGLAKAATADSSSDLTSLPTVTTPRSPTIAGAIMGTAAYMSPEQARGRTVDKRTDVWAFGVILFEMIAGANPFTGETVHDTLGAVLHGHPDFGRLPPATPRAVRHVIERCLHRDKAHRYHDLGDARLDLVDPTFESAAATDAPRHRRSPALLWAGWIAAAIAAAALAWVTVVRTPAAPPVVHTAVIAPEGVEIRDFRISPDGSRIAMIGSPSEIGPDAQAQIRSLYVRDLAADAFVLVPGSAGVFTQAVSPDGRTLAYLTRGAADSGPTRLMRVPLDLSAPAVEVLFDATDQLIESVRSFCWTPGGELAFVDRLARELHIIDAGTGSTIRTVPLTISAADPQIGFLLGPLDDRHIAISRMEYTPTGFQLHSAAIDCATGTVTPIINDARVIGIAPSGELLFARGDTVYAAPFDAARLAITGAARPVQTGLSASAMWTHGDCDLSSSGTLVYLAGGVKGQQRWVEHIDLAGNVTPWSQERRAFDEKLAISPDGTRLAVIITAPGGLYEIWASDVDRPRLRRLVAIPGSDCAAPVFTPDGDHLVFVQRSSSPAQDDAISIVPFDGSEPPRRIMTSPTERIDVCSVSADGARVLLWEWLGSGVVAIREVPIEGGAESRLLLELPRLFMARLPPVEVPLIAYVSSETGRAEAFVRTITDNAVGPPIPVTTRGAWSLEWAVDPDRGLGILHFDMQWTEWFTPIALENGRIRIGDAIATGRLGRVEYIDRAITRSGEYFAIHRGEDEEPATTIEFVQGWARSIERP